MKLSAFVVTELWGYRRVNSRNNPPTVQSPLGYLGFNVTAGRKD